MADRETDVSRRDFMKKTAGAVGAGLALVRNRPVYGQAKPIFKAALIGCGGRGGGAIRDSMAACKALGLESKIVALADVCQDRLDRTLAGLKKQGHDVPANRCFIGYDAYKKVMDTDANMVLLCTPPNFRPPHFAACVDAGKHVFFEKPVGIDPVGCRKIIQTGEAAKKKGLGVVAGTIWRHHGPYIGTQRAVAEGAIGKIVAGRIYYCTGKLWFKERKREWDDAEYMVRNWVSFCEMSGDHIVEQHVHTIDIANWFMGGPPVSAMAMGGRARRKTGDQFDFFSVDYEYPGGIHVQSMSRQINGCCRKGGQTFVGQKGETNGCGRAKDWEGKKIELPKVKTHKSPYVQEHIDLLDSIVKGQPLNEARQIAESSLTAVMGRISAYTGQLVKWDEMMKSDLALKPTPEDFETGKVKAPPDDVVPIPGKA
ncbi:MAG: Gfo/Idh/MocA family oxidoreductase [Planctomycetes bacterium]|nr:Gfo/Idh/MocA family oxidoreductase [Planctomycetota bacterium]